MDRDTMLERLKWLALAGPHSVQPEWLAPNAWQQGLAELAAAAYDEIIRLQTCTIYHSWQPIADAPIPPHEGLPTYWRWACLLQTERGDVGEGCARYVHLRSRGTKPGNIVLRWYMCGSAERVCNDPKYFMPLPAKRED